MTIPDQVRLMQCSTGREEVARVATLSGEDAKTLIDAAWWADLGATLRDSTDEPDRHWDWRQLVSAHQNKPFFRATCVKTADGAVQAAMLFRVDALSALDGGQRAIFVDRLATAPRNRNELVKSPVFRGAGVGLLTYAAAVRRLVISRAVAIRICTQHFPAGPEQLAAHLKVAVSKSPLQGVEGWCVRGKNTVIRVNASSSPFRQRFTLAHELAHLVLGADAN